MAKKKKENMEKIIFAVILVIIIAVSIFAYLDYEKQKKAVNDANKIIYNSFLCISDCPVTVLLGTNPLQAVFEEKCIDNCRTGTENIDSILKGVDLNDSRILVNSQEFKVCRQNFDLENNADKYKACLKEILPSLKDEFEILN